MATTLRQLIDTPPGSPIPPGAAEELMRACPAFVYPIILRLRHPHPDLDDAAVSALVQRVALSISSRRRLQLLLDPAGTGEYDHFYPPAPAPETPSTFDAIGTFLSTYGSSDPAEEELINRMIFNPVPADYALTLDGEPAATPTASPADALIDAFIDSHPEPAAPPRPAAAPAPAAPATDTPEATPKAAPGSLLSESLAKIFIKQKHYREAYEIIRSLSLNYPEKSIYFADQLRFLRKLIINRDAMERNKTKKQHK